MLFRNRICAFSVLFFSLNLSHSFAGVLDVDGFGLSTHLGSSYNQAPRKLDDDGVYVFNPGIGLGYDFRENVGISGFSPILKTGFFQDCNTLPVYYATAGIRYSYIFAEDYSIGASVSAGLMNGTDWATQTRQFSLMPLPFLELGRKIGKNDTVRIGTVYAPTNKAMTATSGGGLLFTAISYGHSF